MLLYLTNQLQHNPALSIFLVLAAGFWIGSMRFGKFSLGAVTSTLLAGILLGQLAHQLGAPITISDDVKSTFFLMFLFAVGYEVGPQFFQGLRKDGIPQVLFAICLCVLCLLSAWLAGRIMHYNPGTTAGLLSGASTISAVLGVATDTIKQLDATDPEKTAMYNMMPVAYAVTYIFGTAGSAWILATLGPKLLRTNLAEECKKLELQLGNTSDEPGMFGTYREIVLRAHRPTRGKLSGRTIRDIEDSFLPDRVFIPRIRSGDKIVATTPEMIVPDDAVIAVEAKREADIRHADILGPEVDDAELLSMQAELLDIVVTNKTVIGKTILELATTQNQNTRAGWGVFIRKVVRGNREIPFGPKLVVQRGDVITVIGPRTQVERAAQTLGYADRATDKTDMLFMGLGLFLGGLAGTLTIKLGGIPLSLSTSGGALIAGLICGWLRGVHRTFGRIPRPALWVFNNVGLNAFIAIVGISAGPAFFAGVKTDGLGLLISGIFVTSIPLILGVFLARYLFKMHPGVALGAVAGARTTTAALGAIEEVAHSKVPALGYTITYAVGNTLLTIWGMVIVLMSA